jgi:hypothetical protein
MKLRRAVALIGLVAFATASGVAPLYAQDVPPPVDIFVDESIGVDDGTQSVPDPNVRVDEAITVSEDTTVTPPAVISVGESITITDDPTVTPPASITVNESVTVVTTGGPVTSAIFVNAGADQTVGVGEVVTLAALVVTLNPEFTTAEIVWADGTSDGAAPTASGALAPTHVYTVVGQYEVTVTVVGPFGDLGEDATIVTVVNAAPEVDAGGPYVGNVGEAIILSAAGFDPAGEAITYAWDIDNDGAYDDATDQATIFNAVAPGSFPVAVQVTDAVGQVANDTATVEILGAPAIIGTPGPPEISISPTGSITAFEGETVYIEALVTGDPVASFADLTFFLDGSVLTTEGSNAGYEFPQFTYILGLPMPDIPVGSTSLSLSINATVTDGLAASANSETLSIRVIPAEEESEGDDLGSLSAGKVSGPVVIGTILRFTATEIWVAADFSAVRIHVDGQATKLSAELGAEAFATGNRVVVVADGPVADGNATALKITPIPSKATREHKRVLVVKSDADDTAKVVDEDGEDLGQADAKDVNAEAGDQVVVIVKDTGHGGGRQDVKVISTTKDVSERLDEIAQEKFDEGDLTDSADIDKLRDEQKARDEERVEKIAEKAGDDTAGNAVKDAADRADEKIQADQAAEEADPLKTVRKETASNAADDEHTIAECASELLGRKISREADVTPGEAQRVQEECIGDDGGPADDVPPPEVLECAERVLGRTLDGPVSDEEKALVAGECVGLGGGGGDEDRGEPPPDVLECIENVLGRPLDRNVSEDEFAKIDATCGAPEDGGGSRGDGASGGPGGAPPAEVIECIERVLGRTFDGQATEEERARFEQECAGQGDPGGEPGQEPPPNVLDCIEDVLGRPLDGSVTTEERARFDEVCGAPTGDEQPSDGPPPGDAPPAEVTACAERVLGRPLDGAVTEAEKTTISDECFGLGDAPEPPPPSDALVCAEEAIGHKIDGPLSDDEKDIIGQACGRPEDGGGQPPSEGNDEASKQAAFCDANPDDPHCENFVPPGQGGLPPIDGDGGGLPPIDDELAKLCPENPSDPKCGGDGTPPPPPEEGDELAKLCAENPSDPKCGGDGTPPPPPEEGDELAKLCAENPSDPKCGGDGTPPPPPEDGDELAKLCAENPSDPKCGGDANNPPPDDGGSDKPLDDGGTKPPPDDQTK